MNLFYPEINSVLIIDDDGDALADLKEMAERSGYQIFVAGSWAAALVQLAANNIDVIFCDPVFNADISGDQVLQLVQLHYPYIRVVLMADGMSDEASARLLQNGASFYVEKPIYEDEYQEIVLHLDEEQFLQPGRNAIGSDSPGLFRS